MSLIRYDDSADLGFLAGSSCAFGVFDGVHEGHAFIIGRAIDAASAARQRSVVITFDRDPDEIFARGSFKKLMSNEERIALLASSGVDDVLVLPFTEQLSALSPDAFLDRLFGAQTPRSIHVGRDFRFGSHAAGTADDLKRWGAARNMSVDASDLLLEGGLPVTSSRIRALLAQGEVAEAKKLLGRRYAVTGTVEAGRGEGRDFGFRTANLTVADELHVLGDGVYAAYAIVNGARYKAAVSSGVSPTFADRTAANLEAHILDFSGDLYGDALHVEFEAWLRPMRTFDSLDELIATVQDNINWVRAHL